MEFLRYVQDKGPRMDGHFPAIKQAVQIPAQKQTAMFMVLAHRGIAIEVRRFEDFKWTFSCEGTRRPVTVNQRLSKERLALASSYQY